jgi:hypothetical protein
MPKNKEKGKRREATNKSDGAFDEMLAELRAADLTAPAANTSNSSSSGSSSSSSSSATTASRITSAIVASTASSTANTIEISEERIIQAVKRGNVAQLSRWAQQGLRITSSLPLAHAVKLGILAIARCLVRELGADVNQADEKDCTPLWVAASLGNLAMVQCLVKELGADIDVVDQFGCTPLMAASAMKHADVVTWLVKAGANTQASTRMIIGDNVYTAANISKQFGASAEQTAYLEAKTHCSSPGCSGAGIMKCTGCRQARYCEKACQLAHWKSHKADCGGGHRGCEQVMEGYGVSCLR